MEITTCQNSALAKKPLISLIIPETCLVEVHVQIFKRELMFCLELVEFIARLIHVHEGVLLSVPVLFQQS